MFVIWCNVRVFQVGGSVCECFVFPSVMRLQQTAGGCSSAERSTNESGYDRYIRYMLVYMAT